MAYRAFGGSAAGRRGDEGGGDYGSQAERSAEGFVRGDSSATQRRHESVQTRMKRKSEDEAIYRGADGGGTFGIRRFWKGKNE